MQCISLHKEIALQNALRYNFALLRMSEFKGENSLPVIAFSKKIFREAKT